MPIDQPSLDDVVHGQRERRGRPLAQPQQHAAQQRAAREIERAAGLFRGQSESLRLARGSPAAPTGPPPAARSGAAGWITCTGAPSARGEDRAQRLVAAHDLAEAARQHRARPAALRRAAPPGML